MKSSYTQLIPALVEATPELNELYHIARVLDEQVELEEGLQSLLSEQEKIPDIKSPPKAIPKEIEHDIQVMNSFQQFPKILKKQFLLPDELFDQKLVKRDLLIQTPVYKENRISWDKVFEEASRDSETKRLNRQRTYILLDRSSSTEKYDRLNLMKAIALLHLGSHEKGKGEVYFRSFNQNIGPLCISKNDGELQDLINQHLLHVKPEGQTQLEQAIETALEDIKYSSFNESWEFLILSDGLSKIDANKILSKSEQVKYHMVVVGGDLNNFSDKELREIFKEKNKKVYERIDALPSHKDRESQLDKLEHSYYAEKKKLPKQLNDERIVQLKKLCDDSGGLWIHCPDLNETQRSIVNKESSIIDQIKALYKILEDPNLSPLEREHYLNQLLLLQNELRQLKEASKKYTEEELEAIDEELKNFLDQHEELKDLIIEQSLRIKHFSPGGEGNQHNVWLLLLKKLKASILDKLKNKTRL